MDKMREREEQQTNGTAEHCGQECEACGAEMYGLQCKLVCPNCGYKRDCSDP